MKLLNRFKDKDHIFIPFMLVICIFSLPVFSDLAADIEAVKDILRVNNLSIFYGNVTDTGNNRIISLDLTCGSLMGTKITDIPPSIGVLDSLRYLEITGSPEGTYGLYVSNLPKEIGNLKALKYFCFTSGSFYLSNFPDEFFNCTNLEYLNLGSTKGGGGVHEGFAKLKKLRVLILNYCNIYQLPTWIGELDSLRVLDCSWNQGIKIPAELFNCEKLHKLDLAYSNIRTIPPEIGNCIEMDTLILTRGSLRTLPQEITKLQLIKYLDLSFHYLSPDSMTPEVKAWADKYDPDWLERQKKLPTIVIKYNKQFSESTINHNKFGLKIEINSETNVALKIVDTKGRIINTNPSLHLRAGANQISLPNQLGAGVYFITVVKGREVFTERLIVNR
jgi:Leucine-rich repeat (LRR) protein